MVAVGGVRGAHGARPLARVPHIRCPGYHEHRRLGPWHRRTDGHTVAGVPDDRSADRLAPSQKPHWLDLLRRGPALRNKTLYRCVLRVHPVRKCRVAIGGVRRLDLFVARVYGAGPGGSVPDAAVPQWPTAISPMANRGVGGD